MTLYQPPSDSETEIDLSSLTTALWRRKGWVVLWTLVGFALAFVFLLLIDPVYKANSKVLIERRETVFTRPSDERNLAIRNDFDTLSIVSQVEVLQSRNILLPVVEKLQLDKRSEFNRSGEQGAPSGGFFSNLLSLAGLRSGDSANVYGEGVIAALYDRLSVYAINDSRVISVDVRSEDPRLAAAIANAITEEYLLTQREDSRANTESASRFLETEIESLREKVALSEKKVEDFRSGAGLIAAGDESTLTKQQLGEMLTLLSEVNGQRAEAEAKADQIKRLINSGAALDSSSEVQGSPLIQRLREQQVALKARIVDLSTALLPNHPQVQAVRSQLADLENEISRQALLIAKALEGDAEVAKVRQEELQQEVARLKAETARSNEEEIKLRALEREARAQRDLLETYLNRYREAKARQNTELLPVNARIISRASVPIRVHFPKKVPTLAVASFAGFFLSAVFILVSELMSGRSIRTVEAVPADLKAVVGSLASEANRDVSRSEPVVERTEPQPVLHSVKGVEPVLSVSDEMSDSRGAEDNRGSESVRMGVEDPVPLSDQEQIMPDSINTAPAITDEPDEIEPQRNEAADYNPDYEEPLLPDTLLQEPVRTAEGSDLYTLDDALETIKRHDLNQIAIVPVLNDENCADAALDIARILSGHREGVVFIDLTPGGDETGPLLPGVSDVVSGEAMLDEVVFADPVSKVDLVTFGRAPLYEADWTEGQVDDVLAALTQNYHTVVLHNGENVRSYSFPNLSEWSDMILCASHDLLTRHDMAEILQNKIGAVPGHSMFVKVDLDGNVETAA